MDVGDNGASPSGGWRPPATGSWNNPPEQSWNGPAGDEPASRRERRRQELIGHGGVDHDVTVRPPRQRRPWHVGRSKVLAVGATAAVVVGGLTATMSLAATTSPGQCSVDYKVTAQWPGGFGTDIVLTNNAATAIDNWTLTWSFSGGQTIYQHWGTDLDQNGGAIVAKSEPNEGLVKPGAAFHLGFLSHWDNVKNPAPADFALNGKACSVTSSSVASPTAASSTKTTAPAKPATTTPPKATTKPPAAGGAAPAGGATCAVIYEIESEWPAGGHKAFQGDIQIVNLTPNVLTKWSLGWTFPNDQTIYQHWGTDLDASGAKIVATSEPNEGWINANGGRFHLGFLANVTAANAKPTSFTFNGATCPLVDDNLVPVGGTTPLKPVPAPVKTPAAPAATTKPAATTTAAGAAAGGGTCQAIYEIETSWPTSAGRAFLGDVQLVNTTNKVLTTWSFGWSFAGNQKIYQSWGADFSQAGQRITANSEPNEGYVGANGGRFHMGFLANYTGDNAVPGTFTLNGQPCALIQG